MMMQIENKKEWEREVTALLLLTVVMMGCTVSTVTAATVYFIDYNDIQWLINFKKAAAMKTVFNFCNRRYDD